MCPILVLGKAPPFQSEAFTSDQVPEKEQTQVLCDGFLMGVGRMENLSSTYTVGIYQQEKNIWGTGRDLDSDFNKAKKNSLEEFQMNFK